MTFFSSNSSYSQISPTRNKAHTITKMQLHDKNNDLSFLRGALFLPCFVFVESNSFFFLTISLIKRNSTFLRGQQSCLLSESFSKTEDEKGEGKEEILCPQT